MNRRTFLRSSSSAAAALAVVRVPAWATPLHGRSQPPVTAFADVRRGVGVFTGNGGTIGYLVNADGAVAVDSQFPATATPCVAGLKGRAPKGLSLLINTHHHGDHTGGNAVFRPAVKSIVQHANCDTWHRKVAEQANTTAAQAFADVTFTEVWTQDFGNEKIEARYFGAGHTGGDCAVTFQNANVVHLGDLYFNRVHPNIDRAAGANIGSWVTVLERITARASNDTIFISGHAKAGAITGAKADVLHFRDYLSAALEHARRGVQAGKSREEVQAVTALPGFDDVASLNARLTLAFVVGLAYDELTAKP